MICRGHIRVSNDALQIFLVVIQQSYMEAKKDQLNGIAWHVVIWWQEYTQQGVRCDQKAATSETVPLLEVENHHVELT